MDELENRSLRNYLRIIGLTETFKLQLLLYLCQTMILKSPLGIQTACTAKYADCIDLPQNDRQTPRPVIVRYLNYVDRQQILQQFRATSPLQIKGHKLLIFVDYWVEVSRKRRHFANVWSRLHNNKVRFTLAYLAILQVTTPEGHQQPLNDQERSQDFYGKYAGGFRTGERDNRGAARNQDITTSTRCTARPLVRQYTPSPWQGRYCRYWGLVCVWQQKNVPIHRGQHN